MTENDVKSFCLDQSDLDLIKRIKNRLVKSQLYDEAAQVRDLEGRLTQVISQLVGMGYVLPSLKGEEKEKIFSRQDVKSLIELTNKPLRDALQRYENSVKTLIDQNISGLMTTIHEQQDLAKEEAIAFGNFMVEKYQSYHALQKGTFKLLAGWRKIDDVSDWDGEPTTIYNSTQVYEHFVADKVEKVRQAQIAQELSRNNQSAIINQAVSQSGHWVRTRPMEMVCEHEGCACKQGRDYKRVQTGGSWDGEPIFLCDEHSTGFEPLST